MLEKIVFTGIDERTDINSLIELQSQYPKIEFGMLSSKTWKENKNNRYPNPIILKKMRGLNLNLSLHLCGELARRTIKENDWKTVKEFFGKELDLFQRIQLNVIGSKVKSNYSLPNLGKEIIIQQKNIFDMPVFQNVLLNERVENVSVLFDTSGGRGKYKKDFDVYEIEHQSNIKMGFAGGINTDNCLDVISRIESNLSKDISFWIDMETGVRERDWFSTDKVKLICEKIYNIQ